MSIKLRRATAADRGRIFEISSQIWDGDDYVPRTFDRWLDDRDGEFVVAVSDGLVIAFARRGWLFPGHAWLQGIRTDPAHRGQGAAKRITDHFIAAARAGGAHTIALSTYIDNEASIHIVEERGFRRVASYVLLEGKGLSFPSAPEGEGTIEPVEPGAAVRFIRTSRWHAAARGHYACDWTVYPFDRAADEAIAHTPYRIGTMRDGRLRSLLGVGSEGKANESAFIPFLDGDPEDFAALIAHAQRELSFSAFESMVPKADADEAPALAVFLGWGCRTWNGGTPDAYAYELSLSSDSAPRTGPDDPHPSVLR